MSTPRRIRLAPSALLMASLALAGCAGLTKDLVQRPRIDPEDASLRSLSFEGADFVFGFQVENPNPVGLRLDGFEYDLLVGGRSFARGTQDATLSIPARGRNRVDLPFSVRYADLYRLVTGLSDLRSTGYTLDAGFFFDLPTGGRLRIPVRLEGDLPLLKAPRVRLSDLDVRSLGPTSAELALALEVENPNDFRADVERLDYELELGGASLGRATSTEAITLEPGGRRTVELPVRLDLLQAGQAVARLLRDSATLDYRINGELGLRTSVPLLGEADVPFEQSGAIAPGR